MEIFHLHARPVGGEAEGARRGAYVEADDAGPAGMRKIDVGLSDGPDAHMDNVHKHLGRTRGRSKMHE